MIIAQPFKAGTAEHHGPESRRTTEPASFSRPSGTVPCQAAAYPALKTLGYSQTCLRTNQRRRDYGADREVIRPCRWQKLTLRSSERRIQRTTRPANSGVFVVANVFGNPLIWILCFANFFVYAVR